MKALRYLADVADKGVVNKGVLCMLPQSVTMIVDMVTELSRVIDSNVSHNTYEAACIFTTHSDWIRFCFDTVSDVLVHETSLAPLNGFAANSHGRRVWSFAWTGLKVKGQSHHGRIRLFSFQPFRRPGCDLCLVKHLLPLASFDIFYLVALQIA